MIPDDEQIVRKAYQMTRHGAPRSPPPPLQATTSQLRGLPPALIINGEHDVLRDEGEACARKLSQAGVPVTPVRYGGAIHDFVLLNPITGTPRATGRHRPGRQLPAQRPDLLNHDSRER
jgi:acetyl esterase/lipase